MNSKTDDRNGDSAIGCKSPWPYALAAIAIALSVAWMLGALLVPLAIAGLLTLLLVPARDWLERYGVGRRWAALTLACALAVALLLLIGITIPFMLDQATQLWHRLREFDVSKLEHLTGRWLADEIEIDQMAPSGDTVRSAIATLMGWGQAVLGTLTLVVVLPIFLYFLLAEGPHWRPRLLGLVPGRYRQAATQWLDDLCRHLRGFLAGQGLICLSQAAWHGVALLVIGVDFALLLGVLTGLSALIPLIGNLAMLSVTLAIATSQFENWIWLLAIPLIFGAGQTLETFFLAPWLIGQEAKLHPLAVIVAVLVGGRVAGFAGALLALPALTAAHVTASHVIRHYKQSRFFKES